MNQYLARQVMPELNVKTYFKAAKTLAYALPSLFHAYSSLWNFIGPPREAKPKVKPDPTASPTAKSPKVNFELVLYFTFAFIKVIRVRLLLNHMVLNQWTVCLDSWSLVLRQCAETKPVLDLMKKGALRISSSKRTSKILLRWWILRRLPGRFCWPVILQRKSHQIRIIWREERDIWLECLILVLRKYTEVYIIGR